MRNYKQLFVAAFVICIFSFLGSLFVFLNIFHQFRREDPGLLLTRYVSWIALADMFQSFALALTVYPGWVLETPKEVSCFC